MKFTNRYEQQNGFSERLVSVADGEYLVDLTLVHSQTVAVYNYPCTNLGQLASITLIRPHCLSVKHPNRLRTPPANTTCCGDWLIIRPPFKSPDGGFGSCSAPNAFSSNILRLYTLCDTEGVLSIHLIAQEATVYLSLNTVLGDDDGLVRLSSVPMLPVPISSPQPLQERIVSLFLVSARAFVVLAPGDWLRPPLRAQTNSSQWRRSADCDRGLLL